VTTYSPASHSARRCSTPLGTSFSSASRRRNPLIQEYLTGAEVPVLEQTVNRGKQRFIHRYRWLRDVPLRNGRDALTVNWFEIEIINARGETTYRNSFVTDLAVGTDNVVELAACGRARWKIENETFNVLKNKCYNLEHSFGHGKKHLAAILVSLNLLAFAMHTVCDIGDELWRNARATRRRIKAGSYLLPPAVPPTVFAFAVELLSPATVLLLPGTTVLPVAPGFIVSDEPSLLAVISFVLSALAFGPVPWASAPVSGVRASNATGSKWRVFISLNPFQRQAAASFVKRPRTAWSSVRLNGGALKTDANATVAPAQTATSSCAKARISKTFARCGESMGALGTISFGECGQLYCPHEAAGGSAARAQAGGRVRCWDFALGSRRQGVTLCPPPPARPLRIDNDDRADT
jgi:hypothetical protein